MAAAVVTLVGGWAAPASANPPVVILAGVDAFKLQAPQVDFGGGTNLNIWGDPADYGHRVNGGVMLATRYGGTVCASSNQKHVWTVDLMPYGSDDIDYIHVLLQTVASNGSATTVDWQRLYP